MSLNEVLRPVDVQNFPSKNERSVKNGALFGEIMRRKFPLFFVVKTKNRGCFCVSAFRKRKIKING